MPRKTNNQAQSQDNSDEPINYVIVSSPVWDIKSHNCGVAKNNKSGQGKSASLTYNKQKFYLKIPKMYCPFGASKPKPKPEEKPKENEQYSINLTFGDNIESQTFQKKTEEFDQFMIDQACILENCVNWLGSSKTKPFSREVVDSKYKKMVKYSMKDGEIQTQYPPYIRAVFPTTFKAPYEFTCEIYDTKNDPIHASPNPTALDSITKMVPPGCWCTALLSGSIWCNSTGYGVTWRIAQLKVFPPKDSIPKGKCLVDDPDESEESESDSSDEEKPPKKEETKIETPKNEETAKPVWASKPEEPISDPEEVEEEEGAVVETQPAPVLVKQTPQEKKKPIAKTKQLVNK